MENGIMAACGVRTLVLPILFAYVASLAPAQDTALIIGNDDYAPGVASDLPGVVADVAAMNAVLTFAGYDTVVIQNQTAAQILAAVMNTAPPSASKKYVVYYAGHGQNGAGDQGEWVGVNGGVFAPAAYVAALAGTVSQTLTILERRREVPRQPRDQPGALRPDEQRAVAGVAGIERAGGGLGRPPLEVRPESGASPRAS